jgi:hypothetical protein
MPELVGRLLVLGIHALILSTMAIMTFLTFKLIKSAPSLVERNLRYLALAGGLLLFFAANTLKIDLGSLIFSSLTIVFPARHAITDFGIPAAAGACSAWFLLRGLKERRGSGRVIKLLVMLTAFLLFTFADLYAVSVQMKGSSSPATLLPNVSFVLALVLYSVFKYDPGDVDRGKNTQSEVDDWRNEV